MPRQRRSRFALALAIALAAALTAPAAATADTVIPGGDIVDQIWTPTGAPYLVQGDITIPPGATLTIEAGTVVRFAATDGRSTGRDRTRVELTVAGSLRVDGAAAAPVVLEGVVASQGSWSGIDIAIDSTRNRIRYLVLRHANTGIAQRASRSALDLANVRIEQCATTGIHVHGQLSADAIEVVDGQGVAVLAETPSIVALTNCVLRDNQAGVRTRGRTTLDHCTIHSNRQAGVVVESSTDRWPTQVTNSNVTGPDQSIGVVRISGGGTVTLSHLNVFGNGSALVGVTCTECISSDPAYLGPDDLRMHPYGRGVDRAIGTLDHDLLGVPRPLDGDRTGGAAPDLGA